MLLLFGGPPACGRRMRNGDFRLFWREWLLPCGVDSLRLVGHSGRVELPKWRNGRRAGLKIRSSQEGVGSSPTFGTIYLRQIATCRFALSGNKLGTALR